MWFSSGILQRPLNGHILLDTGPLLDGTRTFQVTLAATVATAVEVQIRDIGNELTLRSQMLAVGDSGSASLPILLQDVRMKEGERMRVVQVGDALGDVSVSLDVTI